METALTYKNISAFIFHNINYTQTYHLDCWCCLCLTSAKTPVDSRVRSIDFCWNHRGHLALYV